jgi:lipopolysaccharide cholinephosphotransferase
MIDFDSMYPDMRATTDNLRRQCQLVMLRMLKITNYLCEKHNIQYFLVGGSLLGAIRHSGFIPWDDDLDIGMTRENFEKFVKHAVPELPNDIFFQTDETDPGYPGCEYVESRLRDKYSTYRDAESGPVNNAHQGLQLDIFVYDRAFLPNNIFIILENYLLKIICRTNRERARVLKAIDKRFSGPLVYASSYLHRFGMWRFGANYIRNHEVDLLVKMNFEDMEAYVPVGWRSCLERQYGDFMELPPVEKQIGHHTALHKADPFQPCDHKEILSWKEREAEYLAKNS